MGPYFVLLSRYGTFAFILCLGVLVGDRIRREQTAKARLENELETASLLAAHFLPAATLEHDAFELCAYSRAAEQMGGDWFAYDVTDDGWLRLHIADVTGHGTASALLAAYAKGETDMFLETNAMGVEAGGTLGRLHAALNRLLVASGGGRACMSLFSVSIHLASGRVEHVNSGHCQQFVLPAADGLLDAAQRLARRESPKRLADFLASMRHASEARAAVAEATALRDDVTFIAVRLKRAQAQETP